GEGRERRPSRLQENDRGGGHAHEHGHGWLEGNRRGPAAAARLGSKVPRAPGKVAGHWSPRIRLMLTSSWLRSSPMRLWSSPPERRSLSASRRRVSSKRAWRAPASQRFTVERSTR